MPLEEGIVAWSKQRPRWQQIVLRGVANGLPLSDEALEQLIDAEVVGKPLPPDELEIGQLVASETKALPVSLESVSEPTHVNALSTTTPLTFPRGGLTIVYGDNGSGKSGFARLLKRVARSRHREDVLTDVFRDTAADQPTAKLGVHIGDELNHVSWPDSKRPELQRMLFYDSACGGAYIADEADFPYRPYALFAMDGLIAACGKMRAIIDTKLHENARAARHLPSATEETAQSGAARFLADLSAASSIETLDALVGKLEDPGMSIRAVEVEEAALRSADTRQARHHLHRTAERLESVRDHIELVDSVLGEKAIAEVHRVGDELAKIEEAAEQHAESLRTEALRGVGSAAWKVLWDSAKRFSESHAYVDQPFPVTGSVSRCVLCLQQLGESGGGVLSTLDQFVKDDIQVRREAAQSKHAALLAARRSLEVFGGAVDSHLRDLEASHLDLVGVVRALLGRFEAAQGEELAVESSPATAQTEVPETWDVIDRLRDAATKSRKLADDLAEPDQIQRRLRAVVEKRREIELLIEMKTARDYVAAEIARLGTRKRLENLKQEANTGPITRKILELSEDTITELVRDRFTRETDRLGLDRVTIAKTKARRGALLHQPKLVGARQLSELARIFSEGERTALGLAACFTEAALGPIRIGADSGRSRHVARSHSS